jgi:hypothetical protein
MTPKKTGAEFRRPGEDLHKDVARQQTPLIAADFLVVAFSRKRVPQHFVEVTGLVAEHSEMHQRIDVGDEDHKGRQGKKGEKRQFDIEEGQFDGAFQIFMGDDASRDRDIGEDEEIREPEPAADGGGVLDRFLDFFEIVGLFGNFRQGRGRRHARR